MQSKVPLYPYSAKDAMKRGEIEKWRESFRENCACAGGIDILIRENFDGMHLKDGTVEKIVELYGYKRVEHVLANTVQERRGDGRFRPDNRAWAESHFIPPDEIHTLLSPDELKSLPKGEFVVMKTGTHPMRTKLQLYFKWGIKFEEPYQTPERAQREVYYAGKEELLMNIKKSLYSKPQQVATPKADDYMSSYGEK